MQHTSSNSISSVLLYRWPALVGIVLATATSFIKIPSKLILPFALGLILCAASYPIFGTILHQWRKPFLPMLHVAVFAGLFAVAYVALQIDISVSRYLLAAAFIGHAIWDAYHFRARRIVPRWYAEACGVYDVILAVIILFLPL